MKNKQSKKRKNGVFYTPSFLSDYVAHKVSQLLLKSIKPNEFSNNHLKILDPACGDGELLISTWGALSKNKNGKNNYRLSLESSLCGIDIDQQALSQTKNRINKLSKVGISKYNLVKTNALLPFNEKSFINGWDKLKKKFDAPNGFDIVIANPPWGADVKEYRDKLKNNYLLYKGQYDSSDLFLELSLSLVKDKGFIAFIIPDSIFSHERYSLRKFLLTNTQIKFIGRFGEKVFPNINRACAVIICKKQRPSKASIIECLRLPIDVKKKILEGKCTFNDAERNHAHKVKQFEFMQTKDYKFNIEIHNDDKSTLDKILKHHNTIKTYLDSYRGVEISKKGKVYLCYICQKYFPFPKSTKIKCPHCKNIIDTSLKKNTYYGINQTKKSKNDMSFIAGENIKRYYCDNTSKWINMQMEGINYKKSEIYSSPKILVRKTGVGVTACIDYSNSITNQVVYIFKVKTMYKDIVPLEFLLAVMNSRIIYYYIAKQFGETEWRSHPYLTQTQILDIPLPRIDINNKKSHCSVNKIAKLVKTSLINNGTINQINDAKIERELSKLYELSRNDYHLIYKTLNNSQNLLPVKALLKISTTNIFGDKNGI